MQVKTFLITAGLSAAAGAAAVLLMPKDTKAYRVADETADMLKMEAGKIMDVISGR